MLTLEPSPNDSETAHRILAAATLVFAEEGLRGARVRDIAERAGVNLSAINYHFRGKEGLYYATLRYQADLALQHHPITPEALAAPTLEERFYNMVRALLGRFADPHAPTQIGRLLARELTNPTPALDRMIEAVGRGQLEQVKRMVNEIVGAPLDDRRLALCCLSVIGQIMVYLFGRPMIERLLPVVLQGDDHLDRIARHVASFSWAALQAERGGHA